MNYIQNPRHIILQGTTQQLLSEVTSAVERLTPSRPFTPEVGERLRMVLLPDRIVASLNMEGIVATRRQTLAVMDAMRVQQSVGRGEQEIYNALAADEFVHEAVERGITLSDQMIREVNRLLLKELRDDAGQFRQGEVELPGAPFPPPPAIDIASLIHALCESFPLTEALHAITQAAWLHEQFTLVHPFSDGNGREGRLLQDYVLLRRGLMPIGIPSSQRDDYYSALAAADQGKWDELVEMLAILELEMVAKTEAVVSEPQRRAAWIQRLSTVAAQRHENTLHKQYLVWRQRMDRISKAFGQATSELDESSYVIGATYLDYGVVDFGDWQAICRRGQIERSWLFSLLFFAQGKPFYKSIAYLKRHVPLGSVDPFPPPRDAVAVYFTGVEVPSTERPDFSNYTDPHIRLRELVYVEETLWVYRQPSPEAEWEIAQAESVESIVEEFFTDLFARKTGLGV